MISEIDKQNFATKKHFWGSERKHVWLTIRVYWYCVSLLCLLGITHSGLGIYDRAVAGQSFCPFSIVAIVFGIGGLGFVTWGLRTCRRRIRLCESYASVYDRALRGEIDYGGLSRELNALLDAEESKKR